MKEEIRKQNGELSDAELEGVSGGTLEEEIQKACNHSCPAHNDPNRFPSHCAFEGTEAERMAALALFVSRGGTGGHFSFYQCPYYKR